MFGYEHLGFEGTEFSHNRARKCLSILRRVLWDIYMYIKYIKVETRIKVDIEQMCRLRLFMSTT